MPGQKLNNHLSAVPPCLTPKASTLHVLFQTSVLITQTCCGLPNESVRIFQFALGSPFTTEPYICSHQPQTFWHTFSGATYSSSTVYIYKYIIIILLCQESCAFFDDMHKVNITDLCYFLKKVCKTPFIFIEKML